jgi:hypothetical protein
VLEAIPSKLQLPYFFDRSSCHVICTRRSYRLEERWLPEEIHHLLRCSNIRSQAPTSFFEFLTRLGPILLHYIALLACTALSCTSVFIHLPASKLRLRLAGYLSDYVPPSLPSAIPTLIAMSLPTILIILILSYSSDVDLWQEVWEGDIFAQNVYYSTSLSIIYAACNLLISQDQWKSFFTMRALQSKAFLVFCISVMIVMVHVLFWAHALVTLWWNFDRIISCSQTKPDLDLWNTVWLWTWGIDR